ncbi:MAG: murein biosynthesis integral membrane protein MurJ [Alphaproteobacteria bacterium]
MSFARALFAVSGLTIVSRLAGFARDTIMAFVVGAGPVADAFFVAQRFPNLFRSLFAEGAFNSSFVPLYSDERHRHGDKDAQEFAGEALAVMIAILVPFSALVILAMPWLMHALAPGFSDEPEKYHLAVGFSQIAFPYLLLISIAALQGSILNARHKFVPAAAAPILYNCVMVVMLLAAYWGGFDIGYTLAWAVTLAGVVQCGWLVLSCRKHGVPIPLRRPRMTPRVKHLFKQIGPGAIGAGAAQINLLMSTILASTLPTGAVSYLFYADRLYQLPLGVIGIAISTTLLPIMSRLVQTGDEDKIRHYFSRAVEVVLAIGLPATAGLIMAASPIIKTLFEHGQFGPSETEGTAAALAAYAVGVPAFLLVKVFAAGFFARYDTRTPVKVALVALAANMAGSLLMIGPLQHVGIALASGVATWINAILLLWFLRRQGRVLFDDTARRRIPRLLLCSALMAGLIGLLNKELAGFFVTGSMLMELTGLSILLAVALLVYAALVQVTGAWRWQELPGMLKRSPETDPAAAEISPEE